MYCKQMCRNVQYPVSSSRCHLNYMYNIQPINDLQIDSISGSACNTVWIMQGLISMSWAEQMNAFIIIVLHVIYMKVCIRLMLHNTWMYVL